VQPIAIVGIACRFPKAPDLAAFWELLREGRDGIGPIPPDRWDAEAVYAEDPKIPGKTNLRTGAFIEDIDRFDAAFFGVSPREAVQMDPQQRILMELAYEAFADAGIASSSLSGSDTAVYIGVMSNEYQRYQTADDYRRVDVHTVGGAGLCMLANRLSYQFDLHGPSMAVDSACSSSLVAIFQGCQALWTEQSSLALAGGSNLMLEPFLNIYYTRSGLAAPDGRCKTFSANANGIGRGEGAGLLVLKRLSDAQRDGDEIYAVIRGGAVNHDGRSNGLTAPNRWAQETLLRSAWSHAGVTGDQLDYIELHGTGTALGDTIEANALGTALKRDGRTRACPVGSVKSNIGHLEGAAGVAGVIKLALSLHHKTIVPSLGFDAPSPTIDFQALPLEVNCQNRSWPASPDGHGALAGISSFGLGGTNAHLVLEAAPSRPAVDARAPAAELLVVSARSEAALRAQAARVRDVLDGDVDVAAICMTALRRRNLHEHRLHVLGSDPAQLRQAITDYLEGRPSERVVAGRFKASSRAIEVAVPHAPDIAPAKVARWLAQAPLGREAWQACRDALIARGDRRLPALDQLAGAAAPADEHTRRLWCFVVQYAMLKQLIATLPSTATLVPDGHAQLAACCAAGALSLPAALAWLDSDLRGPAPETAAYAVRCECSAGINPALDRIDWEPRRDRWSSRWTGGSPGPITVVVNADAARSAIDAVHCLGAHDNDLGHAMAQLDLLCTLRLSTLADERFTRLPSYPWQRASYLLPRPADQAPQHPAPVASATNGHATNGHATNGHATNGRAPTFRAGLLAQPVAARRASLLSYLQQRVGEAMRVPVGQIDPQQPLNTMGIDSLIAVEVKNRIEGDLKVTVPVVKFLDGFATADFADLILDELGKAPAAAGLSAAPRAAGTTPQPPSSPAAGRELNQLVANMNMDQVDDLLAQLMKRTA